MPFDHSIKPIKTRLETTTDGDNLEALTGIHLGNKFARVISIRDNAQNSYCTSEPGSNCPKQVRIERINSTMSRPPCGGERHDYKMHETPL